MINSRKVEDLVPEMQEKCKAFIELCKKNGIDVIITSTYRDYESQQALYDQGRTKPGSRLTNAKPGQSYHNFRVAFDFVPIINGKAIWNDTKLFVKCGCIGEQLGMEWAGRWETFKEMAHFQLPNLSLEELRKNYVR
jgi:peptidoglycan L-alanyl-D-glutamate endopeptidase CwlK